jgi:hypothetical protein
VNRLRRRHNATNWPHTALIAGPLSRRKPVNGLQVQRERPGGPRTIGDARLGADHPDVSLAVGGQRFHARQMFTVSVEEAAAIRAAFEQGGEFAAAVELRRRFPGVADNVQARACARTIAGWQPLKLPPRPATRLRRITKTKPGREA